MRLFFLTSSGIAALLLGVPAPAAAPGVHTGPEQLHYTIDWPSGLSLGEVNMTSSPIAGENGSATQKFGFTIDAGVPGYSVRDRYSSQASADFCSVEFDKTGSHGSKKIDEKTMFDARMGTATRQTKNGGKTQMNTAACPRDVLTFLYFLRHELADGRMPPPTTLYFGAPYEIRLEFAGTEMLRIGANNIEADRIKGTVKGPASSATFDAYFTKDAARTPVLVKVPLTLGTLSMKLSK